MIEARHAERLLCSFVTTKRVRRRGNAIWAHRVPLTVGARGHRFKAAEDVVEVLGVAEAGLAGDVRDREAGVEQETLDGGEAHALDFFMN